MDATTPRRVDLDGGLPGLPVVKTPTNVGGQDPLAEDRLVSRPAFRFRASHLVQIHPRRDDHAVARPQQCPFVAHAVLARVLILEQRIRGPRFAFVGAGAVVTKDVPDFALCYGNPARLKGYVCKCGERLNFDSDNPDQETKGTRSVCSCGLRYRLEDDQVICES